MSISRSLNFSIFQSSIKDDIEELEDEIDEDYDDDYDWGKKIYQNSYPTVRHNIRTKKVKLLLTLNRPLPPHPFLDAIASLDWGYESQSVRMIKANNSYNSILNVVYLM